MTAVLSGPTMLDDVTSTLRRALELMADDAPGADDVREALGELESGEVMIRVGRAADLLGVRSPETVKNWARGGGDLLHSRQTVGGQWLFSLKEVLTLRANREAQAARAAGRTVTPKYEGRDPFSI